MNSKATSTESVMRLFDLGRQYDVYQPWLEANGFTIDDLPLSASTEDGERCLVEAIKDGDTGDIIWKISTFQKNGWTRIHFYYKDGSVEETYEK